MAKAVKLNKADLKSPKEASTLFHSIMKASVSGNPKPIVKKKAAKKK